VSGYRLDQGGLIDRSNRLSFTFEGAAYQGFAGDTLASALLANGVSVVGRSFKYHRPRGIMAAGLEDPNAIMQLERGAHARPNVKASGIELYDGLLAAPVNAWPSLSFDFLSVNSLFAQFIPAAFYYKTFMWPNWSLYESAIRRAAGLGNSPDEPDADIYDKRYAHCDVLIVGGGPAGLQAAQTASRSGARVILVDYDAHWGGSLLSGDHSIGDQSGGGWVARVVEELKAASETMLCNRTLAFGFYDHGLVGLCERLTDHLPLSERSGPRLRFWKVRAKIVILATGAIERPLVFPNNDRPGVMLAGAGATYAGRYAASPGRRVVLSVNNDSGYDAAERLRNLGVEIAAIADARTKASDKAQRMVSEGLEVRLGTIVTNVRGAKAVREVELHALDSAGRVVEGATEIFECDVVLTSGGWSPTVHLYSQAGGKLRFDETIQAFTPRECKQNVVCIGAAAGRFSLAEALVDGAREGAAAVGQCGFAAVRVDPPAVKTDMRGEIRPLWKVDVSALPGKRGKAWVDFQNDVTSDDVALAIRENFKSVEHVKRYTTLGMASDQGKTSNVNGIGVMEAGLGKPMSEVGTTTFRPPYDPVEIGAFAGRRVGENIMPLRELAAEEGHQNLGASFEDYGGWRRPAFYAPHGEDEAVAIRGEVLGARQGVGLFEASPLGKIEVAGADAAVFLNRFYVNNMATLKTGRCRYGVMLDENGIVQDDGVLACLAPNHYIVGTTSGHVASINEQMNEWLQCEWPDLDVVVQDVTTAWAVMNVNGPHARDLLRKFSCDIDLSAQAFPHMHVREGEIEGAPCRIQRVSFSGELSYEIAVPWGYGASFWTALMELGRELQITPLGIEALMAMRIEKGFLHVGSDTDGTTLPQDIGFGGVISRKAEDFIGRRSTMRPDGGRTGRRQFVGLECIDGEGRPLMVGAHILATDVEPPALTQGWVTSSVYSHALEQPVALAMIANGRERVGEEVKVWDRGESRRARIATPCVYDPEGKRVNV